ncbi:hypothetical protein PM082_017798 [Marasmius tenuissimus]|nr:hypothetical protein PM082_017798 [Marasmius tenuissimus]
MGQSSSRVREAEPTPSISAPTRSPVSPGDNERDLTRSPSASSRRRKSTKRRSNVRKSIISLVKPATRNEETNTSSGKRKSWLKSRRWSKGPSVVATRPESEDGVTGQTHTAATSGTATTSTATSATAIVPAAAIAQKEAESVTAAPAAASVAIPIPEPPEEQSHPSHESEQPASASDPPSISQNREEGSIASTVERPAEPDSDPTQPPSVVRSSTASPPNHQDHEVRPEDPLNSPPTEENSPSQPSQPAGSGEREPERSEAVSPPSPQNPTTPNAPSPHNRQFPPPGTLVVVQGVVHTTDVPRPPSDSSSRPSPPPSNPFSLPTDHAQPNQTTARLSDSGLGSRIRRSASGASRRRSDVGSATRNRLSALFGHGSRPASVSGGRPSSSAGNADESLSAEAAASTLTPADVSTASGSSSDSTPNLDVSLSSSSGSSDTESSHGREGNESEATTIPPTPEVVSGANPNDEGDPSTRGPDQNPQSQPQPQTPASAGGGMISSSSIDVLGTLLSVAAAATAASLLTGSSDPILPPTVPTANANRSTSPSGGIGLGQDPFGLGGIGLGGGNAGVGGGGGAGAGAAGGRGGAERVRQAWGSIRDRLGLRPNNSSAQSPPSSPPFGSEVSIEGAGAGAGAGRDESVPLLSDVDGRRSEMENARTRTSSDPTATRSQSSPRPTMEARDRMLAEMARAFQLGLGLNGPTPAPGETGDSNTGETSRERPDESNNFGLGRSRTGELPPEGTFERFLVDLQTDLRVALGGGEREQHQEQEQTRRDVQEPEDDEHEPEPEPSRDREQGREEIDELFRLIAEAEAEVRQRQRMIAQRQAALRALVSGASNPDAPANTDTPSTTQPEASTPTEPSAEPTSARPPSPRPPVVNRRARVETVPDDDDDTDPSMPHLEGVSDDSDSEDEAPSSNPTSRNAAPSPATERTEASLARLSSMFAGAPSSGSSSGGNRPVNSITDALNRRRALGIGRTPPAPPAPPAPAPVASLPQTPPVNVVPPAEPFLAPLIGSSSSSTPFDDPHLPPMPSPHLPWMPTTAPFSPPAAVSPTSPSETNSNANANANTNTNRSRTAIDEGTGRINWWRLYRFPPIAAPPPRGGATAAQGVPRTRGNDAPLNTTTPTTASPLQETPAVRPDSDMASATVAPNVADGSASPAQQAPASDNSTQAPPAPANNTVVPVIVVGLQSVNLAFFGPGAGAGAGPNNGPANDVAAAPTGTPAPFASPPPPAPLAAAPTVAPTPGDGSEEAAPSNGDEGEDGTGDNRSRGWPSRAADALRNLRPGTGGRRTPGGPIHVPRPMGNPLLPPEMMDGPGSRTFLIYVIGGYYPPDHHIVTGDPDTLDSFEALLDIADLLGQVKPPTASKEDIERSGLEVIKATQVPQFEQEKKISSNCTERCLICLEDYHDEDDVRVLTCKHAFHMDCVDKWLQEGKNNCPACRGAGVSTGSS